MRLHSARGVCAVRLGAAEAEAATLPHRERYLLLNHRLARRIVEAHADWLDEIEGELGPSRPHEGRSGQAQR